MPIRSSEAFQEVEQLLRTRSTARQESKETALGGNGTRWNLMGWIYIYITTVITLPNSLLLVTLTLISSNKYLQRHSNFRESCLSHPNIELGQCGHAGEGVPALQRATTIQPMPLNKATVERLDFIFLNSDWN